MSVAQAARAMGVSQDTVYRLIEEGKIEATRPRFQYRVSAQSVRQRLQDTSNTATSQRGG